MGMAVAVAAIAFLVACDASFRGVQQDRGGYSPSEFRYAAQNKDLLVEIVGNPFSLSAEDVAARVEAAMQPGHWGFEQAFTPRTRLTRTPDNSANLDYHVAVVFAGAALDEPIRMCDAPTAEPASAQITTIRARMAFCRRAQLLSTSYGEIEAVAGPDDRRFLGLVSRLTRELFPQRDFRDGDPFGRGRAG
jgi:hypothetical protein